MSKQRMIAGFILQQTGLITKDEPIKGNVKIPQNATVHDVIVDINGNFVVIAEIWSHPEGTTVTMCEVEYLLAITGKPLPPGSWDYYKTIMAGPAVFHGFSKGKPRIIA